MNQFDEFKIESKKKLTKGVGNCLNHLESALNPNSEYFDDLILLAAQYAGYERKIMRNTLNQNEESIALNKLTNQVMDFINSLNEIDVTSLGLIKEQIHEPLLIICNPNKREEMEIFFGKKYFPNVDFINYGDSIPSKVFDVIFLEDENNLITKTMNGKPDGELTDENQNRRTEIKVYIDSFNGLPEKQLFLYIGNFFPLGYKDKVYFSNSRFSIYARLKEMLDYIKYYGK